METSRHVMMPLWSRAVGIVVGIVALASAVLVFDQGSYVATLRVDRQDPPIDRPAHEASLLVGGPTYRVPASRVHGTYVIEEGSLLHGQRYEGELQAVYGHAISEANAGASCRVVLREPRPEPSGGGVTATLTFLVQPLFGGDPGPPATVSLSFGQCDGAVASDLGRAAAHLDAWLAAGAHGTFEERVGSRWRAAHRALLALLAFLALLAPTFLFRVEILATSRSVRLVRRYGPFRRVVAELLASEIKAVRIAARQLGPITFHRPVLSLANNRVMELWPMGRMGMVRAFEARAALERLLGESPRGDDTVPFRGGDDYA